MAEIQWESYEEVATYLLDQLASHFKLERVEGKQSVPGLKSGTSWEIDAKGVKVNSEGFVIIECRRHTISGISQEQIGGLAYRIEDTGSEGGIIVSPLGLQKGAKKVAEAENIVSVRLDENSTFANFILGFLNQIFLGVTDTIKVGERIEVVIQEPNNTDLSS